MSIITLPAGLKIGVGSGVGQRRFDLVSQSDSTGSQQVRLLAPPRWTLSLVQPQWLSLAGAGAWSAMMAQLRGRANVLASWDPGRPAPLGTARGSMVTSGVTAAGAVAVAITGATHRNLLSAPSALDNAAWSKSSTVIGTNSATAPDGTFTADLATVTASSSGGVFQNRAVTPGAAYTFSFWAKRAASVAAAYRIYDNTNAANIMAASFYSSISASAWTRVSLSFTAPAGCVSIRCYPCADGGGALAHGAFLWGSQLDAGDLTEFSPAPNLLAGDWIQIGSGLGTSHYCMVTADAVATDAGALTVAIEPPTRQAFSSGTAVVWDKPLAYYRQQGDATSWTYTNGGTAVAGLAADLMETWQ